MYTEYNVRVFIARIERAQVVVMTTGWNALSGAVAGRRRGYGSGFTTRITITVCTSRLSLATTAIWPPRIV